MNYSWIFGKSCSWFSPGSDILINHRVVVGLVGNMRSALFEVGERVCVCVCLLSGEFKKLPLVMPVRSSISL